MLKATGWQKLAHVANKCRAKDLRKQVDFTSSVTSLQPLSLQLRSKDSELPATCTQTPARLLMSGTSSQVQHVVVDDGTCTAMRASFPLRTCSQLLRTAHCSLQVGGRRCAVLSELRLRSAAAKLKVSQTQPPRPPRASSFLRSFVLDSRHERKDSACKDRAES